MVELEPYLDLTEEGLANLISNENSLNPMKHDEKQKVQIYRIVYLDDFVKDLPRDLHGQLEDADLLDNRFVLYIDKKSGLSDDEIQEDLIKIDGIKDAQIVYAWILGRD
ncbi:hypothetical protein [Nitrosopumilus sp.]|uniref:hypothetical protein n=1 Tax=Nitrosopumilus sp. TaxID=2024843 RepID=UPI0029319BBA|nr:hypothetical protein [Nitrosopumilus sp.]